MADKMMRVEIARRTARGRVQVAVRRGAAESAPMDYFEFPERTTDLGLSQADYEAACVLEAQRLAVARDEAEAAAATVLPAQGSVRSARDVKRST